MHVTTSFEVARDMKTALITIKGQEELSKKRKLGHRHPCRRCLYNAAKLDGSRKKRRFSLENVLGSPPSVDIIGYACDVGIKSLLRSICDFYMARLRTYVGSTDETILVAE